MPTAKEMMKVASSQVGVKESPANSNRTKYGEAFGLNGEPWCFIFEWWCGKTAAEKYGGENPFPHNSNAAYGQDEIVSRKGGKWILEKTTSTTAKRSALLKLEAGDCVDFDFGRVDAYRDHTGLVESVSGEYVYCIEGNTSPDGSGGSQSNGGMVCRKKRHYSLICSAARPKYDKEKKVEKKTYPGKFPSLIAFTGDLIAQEAKRLAWPYGTPKRKRIYPIGRPTVAFRRALNKVFPNRRSWNRQAAAGASCDVAMATTVRAVGYDKHMPRGGSDQPKHFAKHKDKWKRLKVKDWKDMKPGDVICIGNHRAIYVGDGWTCEAGFGGKRYMTTIKAKNYKPGRKFYAVYRPKKAMRKCFKRGDKGRQVKRLQRLLKWLGYYKGTPDGVFGRLTEEAVVLFKRDNNFEKINGLFGAKSLRVAKKLKR